MSATALLGADIFDGERRRHGEALLIEGGRIAALLPPRDLPAGVRRLDLGGGLLAPGFIDVQVNGGGGVLLNDRPDVEAIRTIARAHRRFGTTGLLPTLITDTAVRMAEAGEALRAALGTVPGVIGLHYEGPFLNPERKGVHDPALMRVPGEADFGLLSGLPGRNLVTLAPERVPAGTIARLAAAGVRVAAGHSAATYAQVRAALGEGMTGFTHLYNAMPPLQGREPGVVGAALLDAGSWCGIIVDGHHVHPASLRLALAAKPRGRLMLVTDAMPPVGTGVTGFRLQGRDILVADGRCALADGTLAGSALDMAQAVSNAVRLLDVDLEEALRMASLYPAAFLGLDSDRGRLAPGFRADLVLLDAELRVRETWIGGLASADA